MVNSGNLDRIETQMSLLGRNGGGIKLPKTDGSLRRPGFGIPVPFLGLLASYPKTQVS